MKLRDKKKPEPAKPTPESGAPKGWNLTPDELLLIYGVVHSTPLQGHDMRIAARLLDKLEPHYLAVVEAVSKKKAAAGATEKA